MTTPDCRHTEGPQHDCDYVEQRNAKVHVAMREPTPEAFADKMNDLMRTPNWNCRGTTRYLCCVPKEAHRFFAGPIAGAA